MLGLPLQESGLVVVKLDLDVLYVGLRVDEYALLGVEPGHLVGTQDARLSQQPEQTGREDGGRER